VYLQRNVPSAGEAVFTFLDGQRNKTSSTDLRPELLANVGRLARVASSRRGTFALRSGDVRYLAVPRGPSRWWGAARLG
jgi:hypothetical protein